MDENDDDEDDDGEDKDDHDDGGDGDYGYDIMRTTVKIKVLYKIINVLNLLPSCLLW